MVCVIMCLSSSIIFADDLYSYVGLYTDDGDVYVNIDSSSGNGSVHNYYNGEELLRPSPSPSSSSGSSKMSDNSFYSKIGDIFYDYSYSSKEWRQKKEFDTFTQRIAHEAFSRYFMPRDEVYEELGKLKFEIMVLQEQVEVLQPHSSVFKTECEIRKELMLEHNLPSIDCGDQTYVNDNGQAVTLESLIPAEAEFESKPSLPKLAKKYTYSQDRLDIFQELCNKGVQKFCIILSNQGIENQVDYVEINETVIMEEEIKNEEKNEIE